MRKLKKIILVIFLTMVVYSLGPIVPFMLMKGADKSENNRKAVESLKGKEGEYFSFIVFGDNHAGLVFNDASCLKLIWHMNREDRFGKVPIDFALNVGDVTLNGRKGDFEAYKKIQKLIKWPLISLKGNHDDGGLFGEYCGESEFCFRDRNSFFIVLDNEKGELTPAQFKWFEEKLKEGSSARHIFIAMHKPPFEPYQQDWYSAESKPWSYEFRKLCEKYSVRMVFSGHRHMFKEAEFGGTKNLVTGGGGMFVEIPESEGGTLHYVSVLVNNDYVTYETRKISPPLWEIITFYFWKEAVYWLRNFYGSGYVFGKKRY